MRLAHYEPLSLSDFPGRLATTVFTVGCNFACPYCHNPELVTAMEDTPQLTEEAFFAFLERRKSKLNGVCITGGEPTLHADLARFVERIRALGYAVKLDTNGSNPEMLEHLLETSSLDYVAMDVKAPPSRYGEMTGNLYAVSWIALCHPELRRYQDPRPEPCPCQRFCVRRPRSHCGPHAPALPSPPHQHTKQHLGSVSPFTPPVA